MFTKLLKTACVVSVGSIWTFCFIVCIKAAFDSKQARSQPSHTTNSVTGNQYGHKQEPFLPESRRLKGQKAHRSERNLRERNRCARCNEHIHTSSYGNCRTGQNASPRIRHGAPQNPSSKSSLRPPRLVKRTVCHRDANVQQGALDTACRQACPQHFLQSYADVWTAAECASAFDEMDAEVDGDCEAEQDESERIIDLLNGMGKDSIAETVRIWFSRAMWAS